MNQFKGMPDKRAGIKFIFSNIGGPDDQFDAGRVDVGRLQQLFKSQDTDAPTMRVRTPMRSSMVSWLTGMPPLNTNPLFS